MLLFRLYLLIFLLIGCDEPTITSDSGAAVSCPAPASMTDNEVVGYLFTYSDGVQVEFHIEKVADNNSTGKITIYTSDGDEYQTTLTGNCNDTPLQPINDELSDTELPREISFLLFGSTPPLLSLDDNISDGNGIAVADVMDMQKSICSYVDLNLVVGFYSAEKCISASTDLKQEVITHFFKTSGGIIPLHGLLTYELTVDGATIYVELVEWNTL